MTRRQIRQCCTVCALTIIAVALGVGVPLGLALGRLTWRAVAGSLDVASDPFTSVAALGLVVVVAVLVSVLAAVHASRSARSRLDAAGLAPAADWAE
jgi:hypothetical protein